MAKLEEKPQITSPEFGPRSVTSYSLIRRTVAMGWVLFLCLIAGGAGIALASTVSFAGY